MKKIIAVMFAAIVMLFSVVPAFAAVSPEPSTFKYKVEIIPTEGGDGDYKFTTGIDKNGEQHVFIEPIPYDGYTFDHWEISGGPFRTDSKYTDANMNIIISGDIVCTPYYRKASNGGTTGPVATATAKKDNSTTSPKTGASDVVPYVVLVLSLAACSAAVVKLVKSK